ncbi:MAG: J domain-containing protein [Spirochaetes bacterium]|nr:J domain-containing protein [Spirochaetota bacterium]
MEIEKAFTVLGLTEASTLTDLNCRFRKLAKRYHPDSNPENGEWAHSKMTNLNLAYEAALEYFAAGRKEGSVQDKTVESERDQQRRKVFVSFNHAMNQVLDGVYLFYQYGLENPHMRKGGVRRLRYSDALRAVKKGIARIEGLEKSGLFSEHFEGFVSFSKAFLQNMLMERFYVPSSDTLETLAYRHYREGAELLDSAIKQVFFGDLLPDNKRGSISQYVELSGRELMTVLTKYSHTGWVAEAVMKVYLLDLLRKVIGLFRRMRY